MASERYVHAIAEPALLVVLDEAALAQLRGCGVDEVSSSLVQQSVALQILQIHSIQLWSLQHPDVEVCVTWGRERRVLCLTAESWAPCGTGVNIPSQLTVSLAFWTVYPAQSLHLGCRLVD